MIIPARKLRRFFVSTEHVLPATMRHYACICSWIHGSSTPETCLNAPVLSYNEFWFINRPVGFITPVWGVYFSLSLSLYRRMCVCVCLSVCVHLSGICVCAWGGYACVYCYVQGEFSILLRRSTYNIFYSVLWSIGYRSVPQVGLKCIVNITLSADQWEENIILFTCSLGCTSLLITVNVYNS